MNMYLYILKILDFISGKRNGIFQFLEISLKPKFQNSDPKAQDCQKWQSQQVKQESTNIKSDKPDCQRMSFISRVGASHHIRKKQMLQRENYRDLTDAILKTVEKVIEKLGIYMRRTHLETVTSEMLKQEEGFLPFVCRFVDLEKTYSFVPEDVV